MRDGNNRHILFVGDVPASGETAPVLETLESDLEVTTVAAAGDAIDRLDGDDITFDCVVSEYDLADMDGLSLLESVREMHDAIPFILERSDADDGVIEDAIAEGVTDFYLNDDTGAAKMALKTRVETAIEAGPTIDDGIDFFHPDDRETIAEKVTRFAEEGKPFDVELRLVTAKDNRRWVRAVGVSDGKGEKITGLRGAIRDVTERKKREKRLRRYEQAVENSGHAVFITGAEGTIEYVNPAFEEITGFGADDVVGHTPSILASGEMSEAFFEDLWETILDGETWEGDIINRRADGDLYYAEQTIAPILDDSGDPTAFVAVQRDVTGRRERERELERARRQLRAIVDLIPDPIFLKNRSGEYVFANKALADVYGETPETVEGKTGLELDVPRATARRFGEQDRAVIENRRAERIEGERVRTASGEERVFETIKIPYELEPTEETAVLGYARDITDLKEQEEALASQRDDLEILNQMVRHDIRNDLQLVRSYVEMLDEHVDDEADDYVEIVEKRTDKAIELTRTARELAQLLLHEGTEPRSTSLDEPITEQVEALRSSFPESDVRIESSITSTAVVADEMVEAVVRNLLQNAVYHNDKETPIVSISTEERSDAVRVAVADNGPGVPDSHKDEIFGQGEKGLESDGTGIGLYLVKTLVDRYDGDVWVEDNDPEGSVFVVEFPKPD